MQVSQGIQLSKEYVLKQMDDLGKSMSQAVSIGDVNLTMEFMLRLSELVQASGGDSAPIEILEKLNWIMNQPVVVTPELSRALAPESPAEEKVQEPQPTVQETLPQKRVVVLPKDPTELTEKEKKYVYVPDQKTIRMMSRTLSGNGADAKLRIFMKNWSPSKPWTCDMPYPIGILRSFKGSPYPPDFKSIATFRIIGIRFAGKSALGEAIATRYLQNGSSIYDLWQANDNEALGWLDSPYADRVMLVHGEETTLVCEYQTMSIRDLDPVTAPNGRIFIVAKSFFATEALYYAALDKLAARFNQKDAWTKTHVILIREAQEWITGRMKSGKSKGAKDSAEEFVSFHNALYHHGYTVIIDSQRDVGVAKDVRELTTWLCMKTIGGMDIPPKLNWLMRYVQPEVIRLMPKHLFGLVGEMGQYSIGWFMMPPWHIKRGTSIIKRLNIDVKFDKEKVREAMAAIESEEGRGGRKTVGMEIHEIIVSDHMGDGTVAEPEGKPLQTIAIELGLNYGTVKLQWAKHKLNACGCSLLKGDEEAKDET